MKKIVLFLTIITTLLFTGCDKEEFLDQPIQGRQQLDDFFSNAQNAENFINGIYRKINGESWWQVNFQRQINEMAT